MSYFHSNRGIPPVQQNFRSERRKEIIEAILTTVTKDQWITIDADHWSRNDVNNALLGIRQNYNYLIRVPEGMWYYVRKQTDDAGKDWWAVALTEATKDQWWVVPHSELRDNSIKPDFDEIFSD